MSTFYELIKALGRYGKKAVAYAWAHKSTLLKYIQMSYSVGALVQWVRDRI